MSTYKNEFTGFTKNHTHERKKITMKKLYRSQSDHKITGLCGGLARWSGIDSTVLRLIAVAAAFFSFGTVLIFYIIASIIVPKESYNNFSDGSEFY